MLKKYSYFILLLIPIFVIFGLFLNVHAYELNLPPGMKRTLVPFDSKASPLKFLSAIIAYMIGIAGVLGVIGITWGGIQMVLSTGEDEKLKKARYILIYSMIGVLLAGLAYLIVDTITKSTNLG